MGNSEGTEEPQEKKTKWPENSFSVKSVAICLLRGVSPSGPGVACAVRDFDVPVGLFVCSCLFKYWTQMNGVCPSFIFRLFVNLIFSFLVFDSHRAGLQLFNIVKRTNNRGEDFSGLERRRCCLYSSKCGCQLYTNGCPPPGNRICHGSHYFKVD